MMGAVDQLQPPGLVVVHWAEQRRRMERAGVGFEAGDGVAQSFDGCSVFAARSMDGLGHRRAAGRHAAGGENPLELPAADGVAEEPEEAADRGGLAGEAVEGELHPVGKVLAGLREIPAAERFVAAGQQRFGVAEDVSQRLEVDFAAGIRCGHGAAPAAGELDGGD